MRAHIDGFGDSLEPWNYDVRALIESAAQAADLLPEELVEIVTEEASEAVAYDLQDGCSHDEFRMWAEMALHDFQVIPRQRVIVSGARGAAIRSAQDESLKIFAGLVDGAGQRDFVTALRSAHPALELEDAEDIASDALARMVFGGNARAKNIVTREQATPTERRVEEGSAERSLENAQSIETPCSIGTFDLANEPGLLGEIARWSQVYAFRPVREFAQPAALAVLAAIFGRRWATPTGLGLNLYLVAIGETGRGKDALLGAPKALLAEAGFRHLIGPGDFSSDAAIEKSLRARPAQLMPLDEFGKLAQAMMGRNAPAFAKLAAKTLLEIYPRSQPGSEWSGKARASDEHDAAAEPIHSPTLSLLGVSTPEGFFEGMSQQTLEDGFLNRLTAIRAGSAGERQRDHARLTPPAALVDALRAAVEAGEAMGNLSEGASRIASAAPPFRFAKWRDADAIDALKQIEAWEDEAVEASRGGVAGRAAEQTQKIATLRALSRDPADPEISAEDVAWAFELVKASIETIEAGARQMMAGSEFESLCHAVERAVELAGEGGLAWSHLVRAKGVSKADDRMLEAAVKRLEIAERVWRVGPAGKRLRVRRSDERRPE